MRKIFITILLLTSIAFVNAQSVKKGFKMLEQDMYDKADEAFAKVLEKEPKNAGANLGMAVLYFNDKFPYKDYFKAYDFAIAAEETFSNIPPEDLELIKVYFDLKDKRSSKPMIKRFEEKKAEIADKLITNVREENNLEIAQKFLQKYPKSTYYDNVVHIRNYLEFKTARATNTAEAYNAYLKKYPNSAQIPRVIELRDQLAFNQAKTTNTLDAINNFIKAYPNSLQLFEAEKIRNQMAFNKAKGTNTIEAVDEFIKKYPDAAQLPEAQIIKRQLVFERAKKINTIEAYNEFVKLYPYGEYYVDIYNLKANVMGQTIKAANKYPSINIQWIKGFDNENKNDIARGIAVSTDGNIVLAGTSSQKDSLGNDAWIMKTDKEGKMIWHKTVGSLRNDKVSAVAVTPNNEIVMAGLYNSSVDTVDGSIWILKLSPEGQKIWHKSFGITEALTVASTTTGEVIVGGYILKDTTERKLLLFKLNENGKKLWNRVYTTTGMVESVAVSPDDGDIAVAAGSKILKINSRGYIIWSVSLEEGIVAKAVSISSTGEVFVTGTKNEIDIWAAKFNNSGGKAWEKTVDNFGKTDAAKAICITPENNFLIAGKSGDDIWLIKLSGDGAKLYDNFFSIGNSETARSIALTRDGKFVVFASQDGNAFDSNYILIKLAQ